MKILFLIFINLILGHVATCNTLRNNEGKKHSYAQASILRYFESKGSLPSSWDDLKQVPASKRYVDLIEGNGRYGEKNDFVTKFRFLPSGTVIRIRGGSERVIAMSTASLSLSQSVMRPNYRLMVVQLPNDGITTRQYTEEQTERLFEIAGFKLADYTGSTGKWEPEPKESPSLNVGSEESPDKDNRNPDEGSTPDKSDNPNDAKDHQDPVKSPNQISSLLVLFLSLLAVAISGLWLILKIRRQRQG